MSIEDILNAYKERSKKPEPEPAPEPRSGKLDADAAVEKIWEVLSSKIVSLANGEHNEVDEDIIPFGCLQFEFIGNYIFNMLGLAEALAQKGVPLADSAVSDYKLAWESLEAAGSDMAGIGCGNKELLRKYGEYRKVEGSVKAQVKTEDILPTMHELANRMVLEYISDFERTVENRNNEIDEISSFDKLFNSKKHDALKSDLEWQQEKLDFFEDLLLVLGRARDSLEGKSEYI